MIRACLALAPPLTCQEDIRLYENDVGTVVWWTGGTGPWDVISVNVLTIREGSSRVELGTAFPIACDSPDRDTVGDEDRVRIENAVFGYLVRGTGNWGESSHGLLRAPSEPAPCPSAIPHPSTSP